MPITSQNKPIWLPENDLFSFLFRRPYQLCPDNQGKWNRDSPEKTSNTSAVIFQDGSDETRNYTFKDLEHTSIDLGAGLREHVNVGKGDVIAIISPNDVEVPAVAFGTISIGAIAAVMNPAYTEGELIYQLHSSDAKLVVTHASAIAAVRRACKHIGLSESCIFLLGPRTESTRNLRHWRTLLRKGSTFVPPPISPKEDPAFIQFSSGTTGKPKGAMITHYNASSDLLQMLKQAVGREYTDTHLGFGTIRGIPNASSLEGDKILGCVPFFHTFGMSQLVILGTFLGIPTVVMEKFEPEKWCQLVERHKVTVSFLVPAMGVQLSKHPRVPQYGLSTIRLLTFAASPLRKELAEVLYHRLGLRTIQGYGSTELSPVLFLPPWERWADCMGSCGGLLPNTEAKLCRVIEDFDGSQFSELEEVSPGESGELFCRGPNVFRGYWKAPEITAECLSTDGWFRTGDVGYLDQRGMLYITDRTKELIKYKGFQVAPAELEAILINHDDIDDAAVLGVRSEQDSTEVPRAYVVRNGGMQAVQPGDEQRIIDWLAERVIHYKMLRGGLKFVDIIPRNTNGKVLRRSLKTIAQKEFNEKIFKNNLSKL